jgi:disulfide bond formation protein DsbB
MIHFLAHEQMPSVDICFVMNESVLCYVSFQDITNGSITAVLAVNRRVNIPTAMVTFMNILVMLAVMLSFPLQLFPAVTLLEQWFGLAKQRGGERSRDDGAHDGSDDGDDEEGGPHRTSSTNNKFLRHGPCSPSSSSFHEGADGRAMVVEFSADSYDFVVSPDEGGRRKGGGGSSEEEDEEEGYEADGSGGPRTSEQARLMGQSPSEAKNSNGKKKSTLKKNTPTSADGGSESVPAPASVLTEKDRDSSGKKKEAAWVRKIANSWFENQRHKRDTDTREGLRAGRVERDFVKALAVEKTPEGAPVTYVNDTSSPSEEEGSKSRQKDQAVENQEGIEEHGVEETAVGSERGEEKECGSGVGGGVGGSDGNEATCLSVRQLLFRACVVLLIGAVAEAVPDLALIIDLFGSIFGSTLAIIVPNMLHLVALELPFGDEVSGCGFLFPFSFFWWIRSLLNRLFWSRNVPLAFHSLKCRIFGKTIMQEYKPVQRVLRATSIVMAVIFAALAFSASAKEIIAPPSES